MWRHFQQTIPHQHTLGTTTPGPEWLTTIATIAAACAAIAAWRVASEQKKIAQNALVNSMHEKYHDIMALAVGKKDNFSDDIKQLHLNFFEQVAWNLSKNRINDEDMELFISNMKEPKLIMFMNERRKEDSQLYIYYWEWLEKNSD